GAPPAPAPAVGGADAFLAELKNPNRRKLRKVVQKPRAADGSPAAPTERDEKKEKEMQKMKEEGERQELYIELLGYMEAPNGNIEELSDKAKIQTNLVRSFAFTLMRKGWVTGYRVTDNLPEEKPAKPAAAGRSGKSAPVGRALVNVWPGREVMMCIELADVTEAELAEKIGEPTSDKRKTEVARIFMYRFDQQHKQHLLDEIALVATAAFPNETKAFNDPEPPQDNSLVNRQLWETWNDAKLKYAQSDWPQFDLIFNKLMATSSIVSATHHQLHQTLTEMRAMGEAMHTTFAAFPVPQLRTIVESIPGRIKDVAKKLQKQTGIIIRDESLKLTPEFLRLMNLAPDGTPVDPTITLPAAAEGADSASTSSDSLTPSTTTAPPPSLASGEAPDPLNPLGQITLGGLPFDVLLPLLKKSFERGTAGATAEEKLARRLTL
ncbi:hypothetical protein HKX48_001385, partial [Thoreauomyces humboldtii]